MAKQIKLFDPVVRNEEEKAVLAVLKSGFWASGAGTNNVAKFEDEFKKYVRSDECVAVNNGTSALHLAVSLANVKNKEVIIPSLSFVSTAHAVIYNGGRPVFADIDPETLCIDPQSIKTLITKKTRVILPVHFAGMSCPLDEILEICTQFDLSLVEDAAHSAGTYYKQNKIGSHGMAVCFSFHPVKNLAMPTGGAITLNGIKSREFREILKARRWCGITNRKGTTYDVNELGWNYYMNEFSAAIGLQQLKRLDIFNNMRKRTAKRYAEELDMDIKMPYNDNCSYHFYWIQVRNRSNFMRKMKQAGIETGIHYQPIHKTKLYKTKTQLPVTERVAESIVSLPIHPNLTQSDVDKIIKQTNKFS